MNFQQGSRVIPDELVASESVHAPLLKYISRSAEHEKGQLAYLDGGAQQSIYNATSGLLWCYFRETACQAKPTTPITLRPHVHGRLLGRTEPTLFTINLPMVFHPVSSHSGQMMMIILSVSFSKLNFVLPSLHSSAIFMCILLRFAIASFCFIQKRTTFKFSIQ